MGIHFPRGGRLGAVSHLDEGIIMERQTQELIDPKIIIKEPSKFAVILHNDNVTTMDFVVEVLVQIFHKPVPEAAALMIDVHENGQAIAGIYNFDIAATKKAQTDQRAAEKGFPLKLTIREVS